MLIATLVVGEHSLLQVEHAIRVGARPRLRSARPGKLRSLANQRPRLSGCCAVPHVLGRSTKPISAPGRGGDLWKRCSTW